jgi:hypothetical protein
VTLFKYGILGLMAAISAISGFIGSSPDEAAFSGGVPLSESPGGLPGGGVSEADQAIDHRGQLVEVDDVLFAAEPLLTNASATTDDLGEAVRAMNARISDPRIDGLIAHLNCCEGLCAAV